MTKAKALKMIELINELVKNRECRITVVKELNDGEYVNKLDAEYRRSALKLKKESGIYLVALSRESEVEGGMKQIVLSLRRVLTLIEELHALKRKQKGGMS